MRESCGDDGEAADLVRKLDESPDKIEVWAALAQLCLDKHKDALARAVFIKYILESEKKQSRLLFSSSVS